MERDDVVAALLHGFDQRRINRLVGCFHLFRRNAQTVCRQAHAVKFGSVFHQRHIAVCADVGNNFIDSAGDVFLREL